MRSDDRKRRPAVVASDVEVDPEAHIRNIRAKRAREVYERGAVSGIGSHSFAVEGSSGNVYRVDLSRGSGACTCPHYKMYERGCKHVDAVRLFQAERPVGQKRLVPPVRHRPSYRQSRGYHAARKVAEEIIPYMLRAACDAVIPVAEKKKGRPPLPWRDAVVCLCGIRILFNKGGALASSQVRELHERGFLVSARPPSANAISKAMRNEYMVELLSSLIDLTCSPLRRVETRFAVDRTTYRAPNSRYMVTVMDKALRFKRKAGVAHLDCAIGTETGVYVAAVVNDEETGESPFLIPLLTRTKVDNGFRIDEVKADKGYGSEENRAFVDRIGAKFFCPFKRNARFHGGEPWDSQLRDYQAATPAWDRAYHERSIIESNFSSDKRVNRKWVLSRSFAGQQSEILGRCLVRNFRVLVRQYFERGIEIGFLDPFTARRLEVLKRDLMADEEAE